MDELLANGYQFDMSKYFGDGWDLLKKGIGGYIGFTVVFFILIIVLAFIPFVNLLLGIIEYVLLAGFYIYSRNLTNNKQEFAQFFEGFNSFGQIFLFGLTILAFSLPAIILFFVAVIPEGFVETIISGINDPEYLAEELIDLFIGNWANIFYAYIFMLLYFLYLYVSYSFAIPLIVDRKMGFWDAMELSRKVIAINFFYFAGMYILVGIIVTVATIMTCGVGIIIAFPFTYTLIFSAYDNIIGPEESVSEANVVEE